MYRRYHPLWGFGLGIFASKAWISFFSSYEFHSSNKFTIYLVISWILSMSTFNSANHCFWLSFCCITQAIWRHPVEILKYEYTNVQMSRKKLVYLLQFGMEHTANWHLFWDYRWLISKQAIITNLHGPYLESFVKVVYMVDTRSNSNLNSQVGRIHIRVYGWLGRETLENKHAQISTWLNEK